jgi:hypothetical protein
MGTVTYGLFTDPEEGHLVGIVKAEETSSSSVRIHGTARFGVKPESLDRCRSAIEEFASYVRDHEPGTKLYLSLEDV